MPAVENRNYFVDIFNVKAVKDIFVTVFSKRTGLKRRYNNIFNNVETIN